MRNLLIKSTIAFAAIFAVASPQVYSMSNAYSVAKKTINKINPWYKEEVPNSSLANTLSNLDNYLYLEAALFQAIDKHFEDFAHLTLSAEDVISTVKFGKTLEKALNITEKELSALIDIEKLEDAFNAYLNEHKALINQNKQDSALAIREFFGNNFQQLLADFNPWQKQKFATKLYQLLKTLVALNLTNQEQIISEIQKLSKEKFDKELSSDIIKRYINIDRLNQISQGIFDSDDYKKQVNQIAADFSAKAIKSLNKKTLSKILGCTERELVNLIKFDNLNKFIINLLVKKSANRQTLKDIFDLDYLENRFGLLPGSLINLTKEKLSSEDIMYATYSISNCTSNKALEVTKGAVVGIGGLLTLWLFAHGIGHEWIESWEPQTFLSGAGTCAISLAAAIGLWKLLPSRISSTQEKLIDFYNGYILINTAKTIADKRRNICQDCNGAGQIG